LVFLLTLYLIQQEGVVPGPRELGAKDAAELM
jgi:hypothetical protein